MFAWIRPVALMLIVIASAGCGYSLQSTRDSELERLGIRRIYVSPLINNSYKSGVENLVYNALVKGLSMRKNVVIVQSVEDADAIVTGAVTNATYTGSPARTANTLALGPGSTLQVPSRFSSIQLASEFTATLSCEFSMQRVEHKDRAVTRQVGLWSASFTRSRPFPATIQLGALGNTSALITDSEFDRTLSDMAQNMMGDVREALLNRF